MLTGEQLFLSQIQFYSAYSRLKEDGGKESYSETVNRVLNNPNGLFELGNFTDNEKELITSHLEQIKSFGSARFLWIGGTEWLGRSNSNHFAPFNCISMDMDSPEVFGYSMNLGMQGCGVGQVIELDNISKLPKISAKINLAVQGYPGDKGDRITKTAIKRLKPINHQDFTDILIEIGDSREGWCDAYQIIIDLAFGDYGIYYELISEKRELKITLDISNIRPYGVRLNGFGGVANPSYIGDMFTNIVNILNNSFGRKLNTLEVMLILEEAAKNTVSGNIRRVAGMKQGNPDDLDFTTAKDNLWLQDNKGNWSIDPIRDALRMSNHTSVYHTIPDLETVKQSIIKQYYSGEGAIMYAPEAIARANADLLNTDAKKREFIDEYLKSKERGKAYLSALLMIQNENNSPDISKELSHRIKRYGLNPCVTGDTWVHTEYGARQIKNIVGVQQSLYINGGLFSTTPEGFFCTGLKPVVKLQTKEGFNLRLTENHQLLKVVAQTQKKQSTKWVETKDLKVGDKILIHNHRNLSKWEGIGTQSEGWLLGNFIGDSCFVVDKENNVYTVILRYWGDSQLALVKEIEQASYDFYCGFLQGLFDADGIVQGNHAKGISIRLTQSNIKLLESVQRMLLRLGINSTIYQNRHEEELRQLPDSNGNPKDYYCKSSHELVISNDNISVYQEIIGFKKPNKAKLLNDLISGYKQNFHRDRFAVEIASILPDGEELVYDCTVPDVSRFDANGFIAHNCAEVVGKDFRCNLGTVHLSQVGLSQKDQIESFQSAALQAVPLLKLDVDIARFEYSHSIDPIVLISATQVNQWFIKYFGEQWVYWWLEGRPNSQIGLEFKDEEKRVLTLWRNAVFNTVINYCEREGIKSPNRCTGFKPEGSLSWLSGSPGFSGIHFPPSGSLIYTRRKTFLKDDPIALAAIDYGYRVVPGTDCKDENGKLFDDPFDPRVKTWLLEIPVRESILDDFPDLANVDFNQISALAQFDWIIQMQQHYSTHNTSCTLSFRQDEIDDLSKAVHDAIIKNKGYVSMALLARMDESQIFPRMPFESITLEQYNQEIVNILNRRKSSDFEDLIRQNLQNYQDLTTGEVACSSEICEIK